MGLLCGLWVVVAIGLGKGCGIGLRGRPTLRCVGGALVVVVVVVGVGVVVWNAFECSNSKKGTSGVVNGAISNSGGSVL
jgi:hypothetical protein